MGHGSACSSCSRGRCSAGCRPIRRSSSPTVCATSARPRRSTAGRGRRDCSGPSIIRSIRWRSSLAHRLIGGDGPESWQAAAQAAVDRGGHPARRSAVPRRARALRRRFGVARLRVDLRRAADRPRLRRRPQREHLPALLDLGLLDGPAVPARGPIRLAAADDRPGRSGLSEPPGRTAAAAGTGRDPRHPAPLPRPAV